MVKQTISLQRDERCIENIHYPNQVVYCDTRFISFAVILYCSSLTDRILIHSFSQHSSHPTLLKVIMVGFSVANVRAQYDAEVALLPSLLLMS